MYIIIFEDGTIRKASFIPDGLQESADDGLCNIIRVEKYKEPRIRISGGWIEIPRITEDA